MNYKKKWDQQKAFDNRVKAEKEVDPSVKDRCAAFRIEIAELANELPEIFKWWSNKKNNLPKALFEYADGEKFLIGLGIALGVDSKDIHIVPIKENTVKELHSACDWYSQLIERQLYLRDVKELFNEFYSAYVKLGFEIGFSAEGTTKAFEDKHKVINERMDVGY